MDWENDFYDLFVYTEDEEESTAVIEIIDESVEPYQIKDFIENLLAEERKKAIDEILNEIEIKTTHHQTGNIISEIFPCVLDELKLKYGIKESKQDAN
jgi:hypothetical protein